MDIGDLRNPVEVWEAAIGRPKRLIELLESGRPMSRRTKMALALLFKGDLQEKGTRRGKPPKSADRVAFWQDHNLAAAVARYRRIANRLGHARMYGKADRVIAHVITKTGVEEDRLLAALAHSKPTPEFSPTVGEVNRFRQWARDLRAREKMLRQKRKDS